MDKPQELEILAAWEFPEYNVYDRSPNWFFTAIGVGAFLVFYAVFTQNFLFAMIIILSALILFFQIYRSPRSVVFGVLPHGLAVGDSFYKYQDINKFWIIYEPPHVKKLYLDFKSNLKPHLVIPLENQDPLRVRKVLKRFLQEDLEVKESFTDYLSRIFKI